MTPIRFSAVALCVLLGACSRPLPPGHYPLSAAEAFERLANSDLRAFMRNRQCGILIHLEKQSKKDRQITWFVTSGGTQMLSFTAKLTPVDAAVTKVDISVSREDNGREAYDGTQFYPRPAVLQPVRPAIAEQIDALLTGRPFDVMRTQANVRDRVCSVQRGGLEEGIARFRADDVSN